MADFPILPEMTTRKPLCEQEGGGPCDYPQYLFILALFIVTIALVMCSARIIFVYCSYKRRQNEDSRREEYYRPSTVHGERSDHGHQNYGFTEPPPRYDQLFKRGVTIPSPSEAPPPTYEQAAHSSNSTSRQSTPSETRIPTAPLSENTFTEVPIMAVFDTPTRTTENSQTQSPFTRNPREVDIENAAADIQTHQDRCRSHVSARTEGITIASPIPTGAFGTSCPVNSVRELPPAYGEISLRRETILEEDHVVSPRETTVAGEMTRNGADVY